ncbi:MAG: type II/IV secretion system protein [Burkholderiales bacterium]|nr:type II/IV secretion system protein [Burkholderiales bacterium]
MARERAGERTITHADELEALLDAHAESSSAYGEMLNSGEPPSREDFERARSLVAGVLAGNTSPPNLDVARQTLHAIRDLPRVDLERFEVAPNVASLLSSAVVERYRILPLMLWRGVVVFAVSELFDEETLAVLRFVLQRRFAVVRASSVQIDEAINRRYRSAQEAEDQRALTELANEQERHAEQDDDRLWRDAEHVAKRAPIVKLVDGLLHEAVAMRASDVHIRPGKDEFEVLYRIDGSLVPMRSLRAALLPAVVSRIKIVALLDITERRVPQDGRIRLETGEQPIDLRVSVIPVQHGESVVIRILDKRAGLRSVDEIGFKDADKARFLDLIRRSYGIILVTGPTGSGKTTTLYAALQAVKKENVNIVTVEDPIEYELGRTRQIQLLPQINFGFPQALRHILRHDPDVIMIGEMRDLETCKIAVESALTGHLVFSTLHTNDAASTLVRLIEIGIAPYMIRSAVIGVLAQRLVRRNCRHCRVPEVIDPLIAENLALQPGEKFLRGAGCEQCHFTGFSGRMAIYELMVMNDAIRSHVADGVASDEYRQLAIASGMTPLPVNGVEAARSGNVSIAEIYRACM